MIEIIDPETINVMPISWKLGSGWHYQLDYSWMIQQLMDFTIPMDMVLDVGSLYSSFGAWVKNQGYSVDTFDRDPASHADIIGDFLKYDFAPGSYNVITWVSSIEHQDSLDLVKACVDRSMDLLAPGGVFLATFGLGNGSSYYMDQIKGWVLSPRDAMRVFGEGTIRGKYIPIWDQYRENRFKLRDQYVGRFNQWDESSPEYISAGVVKVKDR